MAEVQDDAPASKYVCVVCNRYIDSADKTKPQCPRNANHKVYAVGNFVRGLIGAVLASCVPIGFAMATGSGPQTLYGGLVVPAILAVGIFGYGMSIVTAVVRGGPSRTLITGWLGIAIGFGFGLAYVIANQFLRQAT